MEELIACVRQAVHIARQGNPEQLEATQRVAKAVERMGEYLSAYAIPLSSGRVEDVRSASFAAEGHAMVLHVSITLDEPYHQALNVILLDALKRDLPVTVMYDGVDDVWRQEDLDYLLDPNAIDRMASGDGTTQVTEAEALESIGEWFAEFHARSHPMQ